MDSIELLMKAVREGYPEIQLQEAKFLTSAVVMNETLEYMCKAQKHNPPKFVPSQQLTKAKKSSEVFVVLTNKRLYVLNRELSFFINRELLEVHHSDQEKFQVDLAIWDRDEQGFGTDFVWPDSAHFLNMNERDSSSILEICSQS